MKRGSVTQAADNARPGLANHPNVGVWQAQIDADIARLHARYGHKPETQEAELPVPDEFSGLYISYLTAMYERDTGDYDAYNAWITAYQQTFYEYKTHLARLYQTAGTSYTGGL